MILYDRGDSIFVAGNGISNGFAGRVANFSLTSTPTAVSFDPDNVTMATGIVTKSTTPIARGIYEYATNTDTEIKVFPNPVSNELLVLCNQWQPQTFIAINDINGKQVFQKVAKNAAEKIKVTDWPAGTYFVQILENGLLKETRKIVVAH